MNKCIIILMFLCIGCSSLPISIDPAYRDLPKNYQGNFDNKNIIKKSVILVVSGSTKIDDKIDTPSEYVKERVFVANWVTYTKKAFLESGLFSYIQVLEKKDINKTLNSDYSIEVQITNNNHMENSLLWCLTLGLIPFKSTEDITVVMIIKNEKSDILKIYKGQETLTTWHHILGFITLFYFDSEKTIRNRIYYDLNKHLLIQAQNDGVFK